MGHARTSGKGARASAVVMPPVRTASRKMSARRGDIVEPGNADSSAQYVAEEQQDDGGLDDRHEQQLGRADDPQQVAPGDALDVADGESQGQRCGRDRPAA